MSLMKGAGVAMLSSSGSIGGRAASSAESRRRIPAATVPVGAATTPPEPTPAVPAPSRTP